MIERLSFIYLSSKSKYTDKDTEKLQIFFVVKINNVNICLNGCNLTLKPCYMCFQPIRLISTNCPSFKIACLQQYERNNIYKVQKLKRNISIIYLYIRGWLVFRQHGLSRIVYKVLY